MPLSEQEAAKIRVESKHASRGMGNLILPILRESPFPTSLKAGDIVGFRYLVAGGDYPLYLNDSEWEVLGFRHDPTTSRQKLVVVHKDDRTINIELKDITSRN
jgi:hypothetical protein